MISQALQIRQLMAISAKVVNSSGAGQKEGGLFQNVLGKLFRGQGAKLPMQSVGRQKSGLSLVEKLKNALLFKGGNLGNMTVDRKTLNILQGILKAAGFDGQQVSDLMSELKTTHREQKLKLSDLFARLDTLETDSALGEDETMTEISALPFLESILSSLGLHDEEISSVIADAKIEGDGIDLKQLLAGLKQLSASKGPNGIAGKPGNNGSVGDMMTQIGASEGAGTPIMDLDTFISELEVVLARKSKLPLSDQNLVGAMGHFVGKVKGKDDAVLFKAPQDQLAQLTTAAPVGEQKIGHRPTARMKDKGLGKGMPEAGKFVANPDVSVPQSKQLDPKVVLEQKTNSSLQNHFRLESAGHSGQVLEREGGIERTGLQTVERESAEIAGVDQSGGMKGADAKSSITASRAAPPKTLPAYVLYQVSRQILRSAQEGAREIQLQLKPPHLGRIHLSLENVNDGLRVSIIAEHQAARDVLAGNSADLRSALVENGFRLEKIDVQLAFNFDQSMAQARQDAKKFMNRKRNHFNIGNAADGVGAIPGKPTALPLPRSSILDLVA